jgi:hypothetical protein
MFGHYFKKLSWMGSEGLEPTTPAVFLMQSAKITVSQSGVLTKLDDEPTL